MDLNFYEGVDSFLDTGEVLNQWVKLYVQLSVICIQVNGKPVFLSYYTEFFGIQYEQDGAQNWTLWNSYSQIAFRGTFPIDGYSESSVA